MTISGEQILLRAYLQSADRSPHTPSYERLVSAARHQGLAGSTVLKGLLGFGSHGLIQRSTWSVVQHLPVIVEIVDAADKIVRFLEGPVGGIMLSGMITLERAHVMMYRHGPPQQPAPLALGAMLKPLSTVPKIEAKYPMKINENGVLLRVFIGESDTFEHKPLYETIVQKVRELGLAGATVLRGVEGYGAHSVVHKAHLLEMSTDLPMVIEIVDTEEKIKLLLPHLESMVQEGMVTMEYVVILMYRHDPAGTGQPT
jgi:PII-like signaling protein